MWCVNCDDLWSGGETAKMSLLVEVTRTVPLESLVWDFRKDPYNERQKVYHRTEDPRSARGGKNRQDDPGRLPPAADKRVNLLPLEEGVLHDGSRPVSPCSVAVPYHGISSTRIKNI